MESIYAAVDRRSEDKGVKIMAIVDPDCLQLAGTAPAVNHHEITLVQLMVGFYMIEAPPESPIGDRQYEGNKAIN